MGSVAYVVLLESYVCTLFGVCMKWLTGEGEYPPPPLALLTVW